MIEKELTLDFPPVGYDEWKAAAVAELKGVPCEKKLVTRIPEGIDIQPLYTAADWSADGDPSGFPGFMPLTRGSRALGHAAGGWDIRQEHLHPDPAEANKAILEDLQHGVTDPSPLTRLPCRPDADAREALVLWSGWRDGLRPKDFESARGAPDRRRPTPGGLPPAARSWRRAAAAEARPRRRGERVQRRPAGR